MIITDPTLIDSVSIPSKRVLKLNGCGSEGNYDAYITSELKVDIPGLTSHNVSAAILKRDHFGLSNFTGMPIHGLLGYDFFNSLAVKVDFRDSALTVYRPKDERRFKIGEKIPITIENHKPYMLAAVYLPNGTKKESKLVIDLGAGHPLSLDNMANSRCLPQKNIRANLGIGFNGPIDGYMSRINEVQLGKYHIKNPISSFPIQDSIQTKLFEKRDGNLGIGMLKKFIVVFNYAANVIYLKPDPEFSQPFEHDMSGLEYYACGDDFKRIVISRVEPGSAGDKVGLEKDDEIVSINFKPIEKMTLEQVDALFKSQNDRNLLLGIYHDKKLDQVILTLKRRI